MIECYARGKIKVQNRKLQLLQRSMPRPGRVAGLLVGYLCAVLSCLPSAYAASNSVIWERGDQIIKLMRQDDDSATPNDHPTSITPDKIKAMLEMLRLRYADEETDVTPVSVFIKEEIDNLGPAIATGLGRAAPSQDVIFHVIGARRLSPGALVRRNRVCAGRVFYRDGKFNIIFGQVQTPYRKKNVYGQISEDFYPRNYGSRSEATKHDVVLLANNAAALYQNNAGTRDDWIVIDPAAATSPAADQPDAKAEPTPASSAAPVALAEAPETTSSPAAKNSDAVKEQAGGMTAQSTRSTTNVEERLEALKHLRDRELISEEAYQAKMKKILQEL